jgi:hypothetical protein
MVWNTLLSDEFPIQNDQKVRQYMSIALRRFCKISKKKDSFVLSVCPSAWNNSAPTERIFMKVDITVLYENLSGTFNFP